MSETVVKDKPSRRRALWFGVLGGAVAWLVHLLAAYAIAEFGCASAFSQYRWLGVTAVAWSLFATTLATAAVAVAATIAAFRLDRRLVREAAGPERHLARIGWIMSAIFVFVILYETIPTFYFLHDC